MNCNILVNLYIPNTLSLEIVFFIHLNSLNKNLIYWNSYALHGRWARWKR